MRINNTQNRRKIIHLECRSRMVSSADIVEGDMKGIRRNVRHLEKPAEDVENLTTFSQCASKSILSIRCKKNRVRMMRQSTASKQWEQWNTSGGKRTFLYRFVSMMTVGKQKFRVNWIQEPLVMSSHSTSCVKLSKLKNLLCNQQQQN